MDEDALVKEFVKHYYTTLDANPAGLGNLYREESILNFDGQKMKGKESILAKLTSQQCQHSVTTVDCLPSSPAGSVLALVKGNVWVDDRALIDFSQIFLLMPTPQGGFYILNEMFRVNKNAPLQRPSH